MATAPAVLATAAPGEVRLTRAQERYYFASQWKLIWWRLRRHRLAMVSLWVLAVLYAMVPFVEFLSPYALRSRHPDHVYHPPQRIRFFDQGRFVGPFVYGTLMAVDTETLQRTHREDPTRVYRLRLLARGEPYLWWGLVPGERHLVGVEDGGTLYLLGTDRLGRDMLSRIIYGARVSLSVGLFGVALSLVLGIILGGISGFYGGTTDSVIQRVIEFLRSLPDIPILLALAAVMPLRWPPLLVYFFITLVLALFGWTGLARVVRGRFLALREEDYILAARFTNCSEGRIIFRHMVPAFTSHLIAATTLALPVMILTETSLSFLGLGLRPPVISWGVLLQEAQNLQTVSLFPWLLLPCIPVIVIVLAFNFMGDGLRDAADPYVR